MKKKITIEDAIKSVRGFKGFERIKIQPFKEHIPKFYCADYSNAKRTMLCQKQCDNCINIVCERQTKTEKITIPTKLL